MLRNGLRVTEIYKSQLNRPLSTALGVHYGKNTGLKRQSAVMSKLFGKRVSGSKKHWYPTQDSSSNVVFKASQFGKPSSGGDGKNTTRRMTVLNKLFMKHITDLLATGEASETLVGHGLQITRVKVTHDFAALNVYWFGSGETLSDEQLELELRRCSGLLRHELSQLALIGEVPRINFVREKHFSNMNLVDALLRNMDFGPDEDEEGNDWRRPPADAVSTVKREFFGEQIDKSSTTEQIRTMHQLPEMRNDVLGLNHRDIMTKILTRMRKSKQAWDLHSHGDTKPVINTLESTASIELDRGNKKLSEVAENAEKFEKFLTNRRERRNTPERKKYRSSNECIHLDGTNVSPDIQHRRWEDEDYIDDELENVRKP